MPSFPVGSLTGLEHLIKSSCAGGSNRCVCSPAMPLRKCGMNGFTYGYGFKDNRPSHCVRPQCMPNSGRQGIQLSTGRELITTESDTHASLNVGPDRRHSLGGTFSSMRGYLKVYISSSLVALEKNNTESTTIRTSISIRSDSLLLHVCTRCPMMSSISQLSQCAPTWVCII